jgi:hypothetical protein
LIYTISCREVKSSEREIQKGRSVAYRQGDIPTGGAIIFPMIVGEGTVSGGDISTRGVNLWSKRKRKNRGMKTGGATPRGDTLFH